MKNTAEIRALDGRLGAIVKEHVEQFVHTLPNPKLPSRATVEEEVRKHDFHSIGISTIVDAFLNNRSVLIEEVIETPSMVAYRLAEQEREQKIDNFSAFCHRIRTKFRDRILFDGESAYLLIKDFEQLDVGVEFQAQRGYSAPPATKTRHSRRRGAAKA